MENKISEEEFQVCFQELSSGRHLNRNQWRTLLEGRNSERAELLAKRPQSCETGFTERKSLSGVSLNLRIIVKMTATTVESERAIKMRPVIG